MLKLNQSLIFLSILLCLIINTQSNEEEVKKLFSLLFVFKLIQNDLSMNLMTIHWKCFQN